MRRAWVSSPGPPWGWQGGEPPLYSLLFWVQELLDEESLCKFSWAALGLAGRDGRDSTLWVGTQGAHTPCHQVILFFSFSLRISRVTFYLFTSRRIRIHSFTLQFEGYVPYVYLVDREANLLESGYQVLKHTKFRTNVDFLKLMQLVESLVASGSGSRRAKPTRIFIRIRIRKTVCFVGFFLPRPY